MLRNPPRFLTLRPASCLLLALTLAGCEDGPPKGETMATGSAATQRDRLNNSGNELENAEWGEIDMTKVNRQPHGGRLEQVAQPEAVAVANDTPWTIMLATVSGESPNPREVANNALARIRSLSPELASARVLPSKSGYVIGYGAYKDVRDASAQRDLERIQTLVIRGQRPFNGAVLTRVHNPNEALATGRTSPFDLRTARKLHPNVDPLYTLQVGVWSDFGSGQISAAQVRQNAERDVAKLRAEGHEAYFYHDVEKTISLVTIGLFDSTALKMDKQLKTPVVSYDVELLLRKFPEHLVNGEPFEELISSTKPSLGTRKQTPRLVMVP